MSTIQNETYKSYRAFCTTSVFSCLHVYLLRVKDSVISRSPSSRRHSWLIYHRLLTQAETQTASPFSTSFPRSSQTSLSRIHSHAAAHCTEIPSETRVHKHFFGETKSPVSAHPTSARLNTTQSEPDRTHRTQAIHLYHVHQKNPLTFTCAYRKQANTIHSVTE